MAFPNPLLVVVSGPSGVGKSTIVRALAKAQPQVVPIVTTITGAHAAARAIAALKSGPWDVRPLQEYNRAQRERQPRMHTGGTQMEDMRR